MSLKNKEFLYEATFIPIVGKNWTSQKHVCNYLQFKILETKTNTETK